MAYRMPGSCATNGGRLARGRPVQGSTMTPAPDGIRNGLPGAGGDLALGIEQSAVQIKGDKTDRGRR